MSGELILLGVVITVEPLPVLGFILVLSTPHGARRGAAFLAAWFASIVAIVAVTLAATGGKPVRSHSAPDTALTAATLLVGVLLIGIAARRIRRGTTGPAKQPGWTRRLDGLTGWGAALLAFLLQPWGLIAAGAATVAHADLGNAADLAAIVFFCLLSSASLIAMEVNYVVAPAAAERRLDAVRRWIDRHRSRALTGIAMVVGIWLVVQSLYNLAS